MLWLRLGSCCWSSSSPDSDQPFWFTRSPDSNCGDTVYTDALINPHINLSQDCHGEPIDPHMCFHLV